MQLSGDEFDTLRSSDGRERQQANRYFLLIACHPAAARKAQVNVGIGGEVESEKGMVGNVSVTSYSSSRLPNTDGWGHWQVCQSPPQAWCSCSRSPELEYGVYSPSKRRLSPDG